MRPPRPPARAGDRRGRGGCGSNYGNALVGVQQGYIAEVADMQLSRYREVGAAYAFKLTPTAPQDATSGREMLIRTTFASLPLF